MINLFHLKCFCDTALMGSLSEAARRNFVSQPAVSKAIKNLENVLGVSLCHHKKQQFKLTAEGEIVLAKSKDIFSSIKRLQDALSQCPKQPKMPLHFVATQSIALSVFPELIPSFREAHPQIELHFLLGGLSQIKNWLRQGIFEFALVMDSDDVSEYQKIPIYTGSFGVYKHKDETRSIESIGCYVEHQKGFKVAQYQGIQSVPIMELNSWELIARTLESRGGYGLIPDIVVKRYPGLMPAMPETLPYTICAILPKGEELSLSAQVLIQLLRDLLGQFIAN